MGRNLSKILQMNLKQYYVSSLWPEQSVRGSNDKVGSHSWSDAQHSLQEHLLSVAQGLLGMGLSAYLEKTSLDPV